MEGRQGSEERCPPAAEDQAPSSTLHVMDSVARGHSGHPFFRPKRGTWISPISSNWEPAGKGAGSAFQTGCSSVKRKTLQSSAGSSRRGAEPGNPCPGRGSVPQLHLLSCSFQKCPLSSAPRGEGLGEGHVRPQGSREHQDSLMFHCSKAAHWG